MNNINISIIVPVYNVEQYLARCINSLIKQTLDGIEIIIVNDGSTDSSALIINKYTQQYPRKIISLSKKNGGLSDARNFGVKYAKGKYLLFVDSDDYIDKDMCEKMYNRAIETKSEIVCSPITHIWENKRKVSKIFFKNTKIFGKSVLNSPGILDAVSSHAVTKIYNKKFWDREGFLFPKQYFEDSALIYNVLLKANKIECVNIPFYQYIKEREGSICDTLDKRIFDIFKSCDSIISFYKKNNVYKKLYPYVTNICIKHIYMRIKSLKNTNDSQLIKDFLNECKSYFLKLKDWENCITIRNKFKKNQRKLIYLIFNSTILINLLRVYFLKKNIFKWDNGYIKMIKKYLKKINKNKLNRENFTKRKNLQINGIRTLNKLKKIFDNLELVNFADFGTLLGIVREKKLLLHDTDLDYGFISNEKSFKEINFVLERAGFQLWRQYKYNNMTIESSYFYNNIKIDINRYETSNNKMRTWLFYRKKNINYINNERSVVEMEYAKISKNDTVELDGYEINIPINKKLLLKEKYGEDWERPNKNWIYWKSPAGKILNQIGYFIKYRI